VKWTSSALRKLVYPGMAGTGALRHQWYAGNCRVLTYHGIQPEGYQSPLPALDGALVTADAFWQQLDWLKSEFDLITPEHYRLALAGDGSLPERAVLLTCDDGLLNNLTCMLSLLHDAGAACLFFVTAGPLAGASHTLWYERDALLQSVGTNGGEAASWEREFLANPVHAQRFRLMDAGELRQLAAAGMTIGSHTVSHSKLADLPAAEAEREIAESRSILESVLGQPVWALAYPFGGADAASDREQSLARQAGYQCAFMNIEDVPQAGIFEVPRVHVTAAMRLPEFQAKVSGLHQWIRGKSV
jgi:peptidoglycan/xylan/chitin deacetylase (PgdA/CDA1 family)